MNNTRTHIEQADGTMWLCSKLSGPAIAGREYWVIYCNGPATITGGIAGFYADSVSAARDALDAADDEASEEPGPGYRYRDYPGQGEY